MDVEKTMQFILEKSAANTIQIEMLREMVLSHEHDLQVHTEWKTEMSQALQDLAAQMSEGFRVMAGRHADLAGKHADLADKLADLADSQKATRENLNILIRTVQEIIPRLPNRQ